MINDFNKFINEGMDKDTKQKIQDLRTELNLYKKCLGSIQYRAEHLKTSAYDYGESTESALSDIKEMIGDCKNRVSDLKRKNNDII